MIVRDDVNVVRTPARYAAEASHAVMTAALLSCVSPARPDRVTELTLDLRPQRLGAVMVDPEQDIRATTRPDDRHSRDGTRNPRYTKDHP